MQNSPEDFKVNPGAVEALLIHPRENEKILIGYARGLVVLWDRGSTSAVQTYVASQQVLISPNVCHPFQNAWLFNQIN